MLPPPSMASEMLCAFCAFNALFVLCAPAAFHGHGFHGHEVENEIFDLFAELGASEEQLDYPTLYASGKVGFCVETMEEARAGPAPSMEALYQTSQWRPFAPPHLQ